MIHVLCGMIASGKSSYASKKVQDGWLVLNDDAIVNMLHANDYTLYDENLKVLYKSIEDSVLHSVVAMGRSLIVDRGVDVSRCSRARWVALARSLDVPIEAVVFEVFPPEVHAERRFKADGRGHTYQYWLDVATAHARRYDPPTLDEGFAKIHGEKWV